MEVNNSVPTPEEESTTQVEASSREATPVAVAEPTVRPEPSPFMHLAGSFLLATALFSVASMVSFGTFGQKSPWGWGFAVLAGLALAAWLYGNSRGEKVARDAASKQRAVLGLNAVTSTLLILILLVGVNYIASRRQKTLDLTRNRTNSLAQQTVDILNKIPRPVQVTYVYANMRPGSQGPDPKDASLLRTYQGVSDKVKVKFLDAGADPAGFRGLALPSFTGQPVVLLEMPQEPAKGAAPSTLTPPATNRQEISVVDEQNLTSALMKLVDPTSATLYFLTGHGELEPARQELAAAKTSLEAQNFKLDKLSLLKAGATVPADAGALFIVGPQVDLAATEVSALNTYLAGKGRVGVFLTPGARPLPRLEAWVKSLGITVGKGAVVDSQSYGQLTNVQATLGDVSRHPLLRGVSADLVLPDSLPLTAVSPAPEGLTVTPLFESSTDAGAVVNNQLQRGGPYLLVAAVEKGESRVLVSANANFLVQGALDLLGNRSFLISAANWTVGNDSLVSIPPKPQSTDSITMDAATQRFAWLYSLLVLPFLTLLIGTIVWWKRR